MRILLSRSFPRVLFSIIAVTMTVPPVASQEATTNLLKNGNIESASATKDSPENWRTGAVIVGVTHRWASGEAGYKSPRSLCLEKTVTRYFPIADWSQSIPHDGTARKLRVQAFVRAENMTKAVLDVSFTDASGAGTHQWASYIGNKEKSAGKLTHDWKLYSGEVTIPAGTKTITVSPQVYGPGIVWIDDIYAGYVP